MMKRALFISRTSALLACIEHGRKCSMSDDVIAKHSNAYPKFRGNCVIGYEAWFPAYINVEGRAFRQPVMEG